MGVRVLFLGRLREAAGAPEREIDEGQTVSSWLSSLTVPDPDLAAALAATTVRRALNLSILSQNEDPILKNGDELAFMPPLSGG
jgi:sulfur-carrier protein